MQIDLEALPNDPAILQGMLRSIVGEQGVLHAANDKLRLLICMRPVTALWREPRPPGDLSDARTSVGKVRGGFLDGDHHRG